MRKTSGGAASDSLPLQNTNATHRAAMEDGYRRILKPLLQNEMRLEVKERLHGYDRIPPVPVTRTVRAPSPLTDPPTTASPWPRVTGVDSPVSMDSSTLE